MTTNGREETREYLRSEAVAAAHRYGIAQKEAISLHEAYKVAYAQASQAADRFRSVAVAYQSLFGSDVLEGVVLDDDTRRALLIPRFDP